MAQTCKRTLKAVVLLAAAPMMVACDSEHSSNPLSPHIAGPLAGITITTPAAIQPVDGQLIAVDTQPVTLVFQSAVSDSPRPFWHEAQIAEDGNFVSILHTFEEIPSGEGGMVSVDLPLMLDPGRTYHWRARALDGANTGPYSNGASFEIYTPVTIDAPTLTLPPNGASIQTITPVLSVNNATVSGPASDTVYRFEISPTPSFSSLAELLSVPPSTDPTTSAQPSGLGDDLTYYWRVHVRARGRAGDVVGPFSATWSFRTPTVALGIPVPSSPDGSATTPTTRPTYVVNNGTVSGPVGTVTYLVQVATDLGFVEIVDSPSTVRSSDSQTSVASQVDLAEDAVYYWRARATNGSLTTSWSPIAVFRTPSSGGGGSGGGGGGGGDEIDLRQVTFLHSDVSNWAITSRVTETSVRPGEVCVYHTKAGQWPFSREVFPPDAEYPNGAPIEGNIWIFAVINGRWYGATWDWLRPGQQCKHESADTFGRDQIRIPPMDGSWVPQKGDPIGLMMSTIARTSLRAGYERTNVVLIEWPY